MVTKMALRIAVEQADLFFFFLKDILNYSHWFSLFDFIYLKAAPHVWYPLRLNRFNS